MAQRHQESIPTSSFNDHRLDDHEVWSPAPVGPQVHRLFRSMRTPAPSSSATQPQVTYDYAVGNTLQAQKFLDYLPDTQASHDRAMRTEQHPRNIAPLETPPDYPSFPSDPPNVHQPGIRGKDDQNAPGPSTTPWVSQEDLSPRVRFQDRLVEASIETRITELITGIPKPRHFIPSEMVQQRGMLAAPENVPFIHSNGRYQGNRNSNANRHQIANLADDLNCALFLLNIPLSASLSGFFDMVDTGAVYALHIMPPNGQYHTCAAKLTFMTPDGAAMFLAKARQGIRLAGYLLHARYNNREGYLCNTTVLSRVLHVEGPKAIMTVDYWFRYFRQVCVFQWDRVVELACPRSGRKCLEFRFARINGQAQTCLQEIQQQEEFAGLVYAAYGFDPCDQPTLQDMACRRSQVKKEFGFQRKRSLAGGPEDLTVWRRLI